MLQNPQLNFVHLLTRSSSECTDLCKIGTHTKIRPPSLGLYYLLEKWRGILTEDFLRIRIYSFLERILVILRYRLQMSTDPDLLFYSWRIRIIVTVPTQFFCQPLNNLFSANVFVYFCRIFAGKVTNFFYRKRALTFIFSMLSHVKS